MSLTFAEFKNLNESLKDEIRKLKSVNESNSGHVPTSSLVAVSDLKVIDLPTPYDTITGTHPSVKYFPFGFSGYSYWMAFTPYPDVKKENPCILASYDGVEWVVPSGLVNPISPAPLIGYNSDTELVYGPNNKLYCYWRWHKGTGNNDNVLFRMESTDGRNWVDKTECVFPVYADPLSPCITVGRNNDWKLWIGASSGQAMRHYTSVDGLTWSEPITCVSNVEKWGFNWHPMVWRELDYYYCLSAVGSNVEMRPVALMTDLYFGWSEDGINWTFDSNPFLTRGQFGLNHYRVYRSSAIRVSGDTLVIYVSGYGHGSERISRVEARLTPPRNT